MEADRQRRIEMEADRQLDRRLQRYENAYYENEYYWRY